MDFRLGASAEALRAEVHDFVRDFMTHEVEERLYRTGVSHDAEYTAALAERGWLAAGWPVEWGGQGRDPLELLVLAEEMTYVDAPTIAPTVTTMVSKVIHAVATDEVKREVLPKALAGEIIVALGFSEPEAGSDVAAAQTRALRDGDEWVISGQKMFTTNAHLADYVFLLTRTNTAVPKHKGLTMFLVPMKQDGIEVQAVYTLSGERTNITYFNDVRVDDRWRIGEVDQGWRVMTVSLQDEHSAGFGTRIDRLAEAAEAWARDEVDGEGRPRIDDPDVRECLGRCATDAEVSLLLQRRATWLAETGTVPEAEGPMSKLFSSEALGRNAEDLVELMGPEALRSYFEPTAPQNGRIEHTLRYSLGTTIYAGTSEVQRNIIAQRGLGLPR
ncbi:MAG: acyl-CoA dehydrogenase family protein [Acidimicrobiia bacterium]|nr:acyl-CoA dehydrogenase family protein [Acidimicrobiia bacterium]